MFTSLNDPRAGETNQRQRNKMAVERKNGKTFFIGSSNFYRITVHNRSNRCTVLIFKTKVYRVQEEYNNKSNSLLWPNL